MEIGVRRHVASAKNTKLTTMKMTTMMMITITMMIMTMSLRRRTPVWIITMTVLGLLERAGVISTQANVARAARKRNPHQLQHPVPGPDPGARTRYEDAAAIRKKCAGGTQVNARKHVEDVGVDLEELQSRWFNLPELIS